MYLHSIKGKISTISSLHIAILYQNKLTGTKTDFFVHLIFLDGELRTFEKLNTFFPENLESHESFISFQISTGEIRVNTANFDTMCNFKESKKSLLTT